MPDWEYLAAHPDQQALFDEAMVQRAGALSLACVPVLDWPASATIADIGGGTGTLLAAVLQAAPGAHGILVEQPQVLERARPFLERPRGCRPLPRACRGPVRPSPGG
jgi:spermidine synthase